MNDYKTQLMHNACALTLMYHSMLDSNKCSGGVISSVFHSLADTLSDYLMENELTERETIDTMLHFMAEQNLISQQQEFIWVDEICSKAFDYMATLDPDD